MKAKVKTVFRLMLTAAQWRNEYDEFAGLLKDGKKKAKRHLTAGNYFLRWAHIGDFDTEEQAKEAARRIWRDDKMQYEFIIDEVEISERLIVKRSFNASEASKEVQ